MSIVLEDSVLERLLDRVDALAKKVDGLHQAQCADSWLSQGEAVKYIGVSRQTLHKYRMEDGLVFSQIGGKVFYKKSDLDAFLLNFSI